MFENKRKAVIISLIVAIVILVVLILIVLYWPKNKVDVEKTPDGQTIETNGSQANLDLNPSSAQRIKEESSYPLGLKQLAMSFAERYGSYSSDADFKNFDDLEPLVTNSMIEKMQKTVKDQSLVMASSSEIFQGLTTKALSAELGEVENSKATVIVSTQRLTYLGSGKEPNISYRKISINFLKAGNEWKVDDANWQ